jgi:hypothetical protein
MEQLPYCPKFLVEIALVERPPKAREFVLGQLKVGRNLRGFLDG